MAFLRKKKSNSPTKGGSPVPPPPPLSEKPSLGGSGTGSGPSTPLYARFASSSNTSIPLATSNGAKVVSGPMMLGSRDRRDSFQSRTSTRSPSGPASGPGQGLRQTPSRTRVTTTEKPLPPPAGAALSAPPRSTSMYSTSSAATTNTEIGLRPPTANAGSRKSVVSHAGSIMSDMPDHMFNIGNLEFDAYSEAGSMSKKNGLPPTPPKTDPLPKLTPNRGPTSDSTTQPQQEPPKSKRTSYNPSPITPQSKRMSSLPPPPPLDPPQQSSTPPPPRQPQIQQPIVANGRRMSSLPVHPNQPQPPQQQQQHVQRPPVTPNGKRMSTLPQPNQQHQHQPVHQPPEQQYKQPQLPQHPQHQQQQVQRPPMAQNGKGMSSLPPPNQQHHQQTIQHSLETPNKRHTALPQPPVPSQPQTSPNQRRQSALPTPPLSSSSHPHPHPHPPPPTQQYQQQPHAEPKRRMSVQPQTPKRVIDLNDPMPISPVSASDHGHGGAAHGQAQGQGAMQVPVRKGPLIFSASGSSGSGSAQGQGQGQGQSAAVEMWSGAAKQQQHQQRKMHAHPSQPLPSTTQQPQQPQQAGERRRDHRPQPQPPQNAYPTPPTSSSGPGPVNGQPPEESARQAQGQGSFGRASGSRVKSSATTAQMAPTPARSETVPAPNPTPAPAGIGSKSTRVNSLSASTSSLSTSGSSSFSRSGSESSASSVTSVGSVGTVVSRKEREREGVRTPVPHAHPAPLVNDMGMGAGGSVDNGPPTPRPGAVSPQQQQQQQLPGRRKHLSSAPAPVHAANGDARSTTPVPPPPPPPPPILTTLADVHHAHGQQPSSDVEHSEAEPSSSPTDEKDKTDKSEKRKSRDKHRLRKSSLPQIKPKQRPVTPSSDHEARKEKEKVDEETKSKAGIELDDDPFASAGGVTVVDKQGHVQGLVTPPTSPPRHGQGHGSGKRERRDAAPEHPVPEALPEEIAEDRDPAPFPLPLFLLMDPGVYLKGVLRYLSFGDWLVRLCGLCWEARRGLLLLNGGAASRVVEGRDGEKVKVQVKDKKEERERKAREEEVREVVLERYLGIVGYKRWDKRWDEGEKPGTSGEGVRLSLLDLRDYMHGVSVPTHEYARLASMHVQQFRANQRLHPQDRQTDPGLAWRMEEMRRCTRAYTRVVLRIRVQAERMHLESVRAREKEKEAGANGSVQGHGKEESETRRGRERERKVYPPASYNGRYGANGNGYGSRASSVNGSRAPSRAPSPSGMSLFSQSHHGHASPPSSAVGHGGGGRSRSLAPPQHGQGPAHKPSTIFDSPLFRLRRAPLLRVFVPSVEGSWMSDQCILECEGELRKAGVVGLLRVGDVVWDLAVGDEGNLGRGVWDGSYLIDLDFTYSNVGDLPKYLPTLAFPPSYFHKVIRTSGSNGGGNPIAHVDVSPWGEEIRANLQLLQDRVKTETPQGGMHNVVRWVHRSSFALRPPPAPPVHQPVVQQYNRRGQPSPTAAGQQDKKEPRISIPGSQGMFVDPGWYGTIVVETEGTNECLKEMQERCGEPTRFENVNRGVGMGGAAMGGGKMAEKEREQRRVWRVLRERSRPGEIWIKAVGAKERIL